MKVVSIRLTNPEIAALDDLAALYYKHNRSSTIIAALHALYATHKLKPAAQKAIDSSRRQHRTRRGAHG